MFFLLKIPLDDATHLVSSGYSCPLGNDFSQWMSWMAIISPSQFAVLLHCAANNLEYFSQIFLSVLKLISHLLCHSVLWSPSGIFCHCHSTLLPRRIWAHLETCHIHTPFLLGPLGEIKKDPYGSLIFQGDRIFLPRSYTDSCPGNHNWHHISAPVLQYRLKSPWSHSLTYIPPPLLIQIALQIRIPFCTLIL